MIEPLEAWFATFVDSYRTGEADRDALFVLKRDHSLRVMAECRDLAHELALPPHLCELACLSGLLHDVGRFPQFDRYGTFRDAHSVNHATLGLQTLSRLGALSGLAPGDRRLVRAGIVAHNRRGLPSALARGNDQSAMTMAKIVRDADKLDILRVMLEHFRKPGKKDPVVFIELPDIPDRVSDELIKAVEAGSLGDYNALRSINDFALLLLSWINDLSFERSRRLFFELGYVDALFDALPDLPQVVTLRTHYYERFSPRVPAP